MTTIGYARVSSIDQDLTIQLGALKAAGCEVIRQEKARQHDDHRPAGTQDRARLHPGGRHFGGDADRAASRALGKEKASGTTTIGRQELKTVLDFIRAGDTLVVTRIDRLARSIGDLQDIVRTLKVKGAGLRATEQPIDTNTAAGKCFLDMLGVFAEFETNLRKGRQMEGIAKAKADGVYKGRPATIEPATVRELKAQGLGVSEIAKRLKIGWASVYRVLGEA